MRVSVIKEVFSLGHAGEGTDMGAFHGLFVLAWLIGGGSLANPKTLIIVLHGPFPILTIFSPNLPFYAQGGISPSYRGKKKTHERLPIQTSKNRSSRCRKASKKHNRKTRVNACVIARCAKTPLTARWNFPVEFQPPTNLQPGHLGRKIGILGEVVGPTKNIID